MRGFAFAVLSLAAVAFADEEAGGGKKRRKRPGGREGGERGTAARAGKAAALAAKGAGGGARGGGRGAGGAGAKGGKAGRPAFEDMVGLLRAYKAANGNVDVPADHTAELEGREKPVRLGRWLAAVRKNKAKVKSERADLLDAADAGWKGE